MGTEGFALGVDLGTSNTVAVLRWPDGRTRALLFDGVPLLPSAAYLDPNGMLHVGRDALRMAALDPSRLEPNPKRRIDEPTVLLGQSVVSTVDLLAAVLATVARAAVEAVGFLPPAALTYPAAWGPARRTVLTEAARRAGWPPPTLVPEPVAAARYFADVLRRPVPVGASIAVFDFGAGTLDVAVVHNTGDGFTVLGSGGIENLGGLDVDAALVGHLGRLLAQTAPQAWQRIANPESTALLRDRGRFWDDVRGAKEMLSRAAVAPVAIPGMEQAAHLTREELDRTAGPLVQRAVQEAAAVIARCGLRPDQLAGLFLVGGSSRLPLVARLLHAQLGVAPTVLEQPELPVAEGALAEVVAAPAPVSVPPSVSAPPVSPPPTGPPLIPARQPWYQRKLTWIAAAATVVVLALVVSLAIVLTGDPYPQVSFASISQRYTVVTGAQSVSYAFTAVNGSTAYLGYSQQDGLHLIGYDLGAGHKTWSTTVRAPSDSVSWKGLVALPGAVLVEVSGLSGDNSYGLIGVDSAGKQRWQHAYAEDSDLIVTRAAVVVHDEKGKRLVGYDPVGGAQKWAVDDVKDQYGNTAEAFFPVLGGDDVTAPVGFDGLPFGGYADNRIVELSVDSSARVIDTSDGHPVKTRGNTGDPRQATVLAYGDRLYVAQSSSGYQLLSYDLASLGGGKVVYSAPDDHHSLKALVPCGTNVCVMDEVSSDAKTAHIYAVDPGSAAVRWNKPAANADLLVPLGAGLMVQNTDSGTRYTTVFGGDGTALLGDAGRDQTGVRVAAGSVLLFSELPYPYSSNETLSGFGVSDPAPHSLGEVKKVRSANCSWNTTLLVCPTDDGFAAWSFAT